ncbi:MAG TPA: FlgD immunoglobulin-like domain containing protein, partial [Chitinivibrionales bacterium]|nr:FlgD immunoglobulin-like domain containing protein [Chitinivibrionales bacterium]
RARAVSSNSIRLTWNSVAGSGVERILIWYRSGSPIPLQYDFSSLKLDSLVPSVADTVIASSKFNPQMRYYFGAQVYANGLWSYVTDSSSASDSTWGTLAPLSGNATAITSLVFDSSVNQIKVCWKPDSTVIANGDSLPQLAIVYSTDSFATTVGASPQVVDIGATNCAYVKLREDLVFNATYYVSLWLRASNSAWTAPSTAQGRQSVVVPMYKWQSVLLFSKDYDTVYAFNRQLRFTNQPGDVSRVPDTVVADSIHPYGFTAVSVAFEFKVKDAGVPFNVGVKLSAIPAGFTAKDVRIFRLMPNGEWMVDTLPLYVDSAGGYVYELTNQLAMPFVAGIDMRRPSARILTNVTDPVPAGVAIIDTFLLSDNIANLRWRFMSTKGGEAFATGDTSQSGTLSDTSVRVAVTTPGALVSPDNGVRGMIIVTDGTYRDTVTISRRVVRDTDLVWTESGKWVPMSVTVDLDTPSAVTAFLPLSGTPWKYDNTKFRVFRWGATVADKWVEYADTISKAFNFVRGSQMWVKAKTKTPIRFGRGVTPSLDSSFMVTLPSKQWVDLALPFNFDITVADIIGSTKDSVKTGDTLGIDSVLIFDWAKDTTGHYATDLIFNNTIISPQLNNAAQPLSSSDPAGFAFYNNGGSAVQLVIPPVPQAMSTRLAKKAAPKQQQGWAIKITSKLGDGSMMSPVYCGFSKTASAATTYYPVSPSFGDASLAVFDIATRRVFGHAMAHATPEGGCAFLLAFCNDGNQRQKISCSLGNLSLLPQGTLAALYNDATGAFENLTNGSAAVSVDANSKGFRWLLVGPKEYLAKAALIARPALLKLFGTYPNPFRSMVRIRYSLPYVGIDRVFFSIYDIRGRIVWRTEVSGASTSGVNDVLWNGRSEDGRPVAAGMYILRMTAFNTDRKPCGGFDRKMTFMP